MTFAVMQHGLHGTLPLAVPAHLGRAGTLRVVGLPALPQVHLHPVIQQEQGWRGKKVTVHDTSTNRGASESLSVGDWFVVLFSVVR